MRTPASVPARSRTAMVASFPAPTAGWVSNFNLAAEGSGQPGATVLDNWFPTPQNVRLRRGCALYGQLDSADPVTALMSYDNGADQRMFAVAGNTIYDASSPAAITAAQTGLTGLTGSDWSYTQFATTGGVFLVAVNGADAMRLYDGTRWWPIDTHDILNLPISDRSGTFTPGDTVTGGTSGATGTVLYADNGVLYVQATQNTTFTKGETVTGAKGGSATLSADSAIYWAAFTGIDTRELSYVWAYMDRLFFCQKNSMSMWYLQIDSIGGAAEQFPLGGVFPSGGSLMFGSSWSLENSGDGGLSEQCVIVTTEGECAIYQGVDPDLSTSWSKVGLYRIDKPRGPQAFVRNGGDLLIATDTGMIPLSQAINKSVATLAPAAVSYPIEHDWLNYVSLRPDRNWQATIWPENQMLAIALPHMDGYDDAFLIANTRTGAWCRFTGWNGHCLATYNGWMYFGGDNGQIIAAWQTGMDLGAPFTATCVPLFADGGAGEVSKLPKGCRAMLRGSYPLNWQISMEYDYVLDTPSPPQSAITTDKNVWDEGIWDQSIWSATTQQQSQSLWTPVGGMGYAFAPCIQITSGNLVPFDNELVRMEVTYLAGGLLS